MIHVIDHNRKPCRYRRLRIPERLRRTGLKSAETKRCRKKVTLQKTAYRLLEKLIRCSGARSRFASARYQRYAEIYRHAVSGADLEKTLMHHYGHILDLVMALFVTRRRLQQRMHIRHEERFLEAAGCGKPLVFLQLHSGSFFLLAIWLRFRWKKTHVVYINKSKTKQVINNLLIGRHIASRLTRYDDIAAKLAGGEPVMIMFDGIKGKRTETVYLNGFGFPFSNAVLSLIEKDLCVIVPIFSRRTSEGGVEFTFFKPVKKGEVSSMQELFDRFVPGLQQDPTQWYGLLERL
jgi:lauroyl/myristoyl acyltransferase